MGMSFFFCRGLNRAYVEFICSTDIYRGPTIYEYYSWHWDIVVNKSKSLSKRDYILVMETNNAIPKINIKIGSDKYSEEEKRTE